MRASLIASTAFGLFILCPRMAGMARVISSAADISLVKATILGMVFALPLIVCMVLILAKWRLVPALAFAAATDLLAVLLMAEMSFKSGLETLIIALFVLAGVRVATLVSSHIGG